MARPRRKTALDMDNNHRLAGVSHFIGMGRHCFCQRSCPCRRERGPTLCANSIIVMNLVALRIMGSLREDDAMCWLRLCTQYVSRRHLAVLLSYPVRWYIEVVPSTLLYQALATKREQVVTWLLDLGVCTQVGLCDAPGQYWALHQPRVTPNPWDGGPSGDSPFQLLRFRDVRAKFLHRLLCAGAYPNLSWGQESVTYLTQWHAWHGRPGRRLWVLRAGAVCQGL